MVPRGIGENESADSQAQCLCSLEWERVYFRDYRRSSKGLQMLANLTGWHFLIILVVVLLLFGAPKLPGLARSLGQSLKIFKSEIKEVRDDPTGASAPVAPATTNSLAAGARSFTDTPVEQVDAADPPMHR